jgi:hemerythrin-like metal-binding protein
MRPPRSHAVVVAPPGPTPPASTPAPEPEATPARVVQLAPLAALEGTREQHRLLHGLAESIDAGEPDGRASIEALVEQLWALAARHFADEEALMAATSMPAFHAHRGKHDELRGQLAHLRAALREGASPRRVRDMVSVLVIEWLGVHIATADHDLERYVRSLPQA